MIQYPGMNDGRKLLILVLAAFCLWGCAGTQEPWYGLVDLAGNPVSSPVRPRGEVYAAWKSPRGTTDKIGFEFYFKDSAGGWKLIFLNIQKPDNPEKLVREPLVAKDLPPGSYKIVFIRNDKPAGETVFDLLPNE